MNGVRRGARVRPNRATVIEAERRGDDTLEEARGTVVDGPYSFREGETYWYVKWDGVCGLKYEYQDQLDLAEARKAEAQP